MSLTGSSRKIFNFFLNLFHKYEIWNSALCHLNFGKFNTYTPPPQESGTTLTGSSRTFINSF